MDDRWYWSSGVSFSRWQSFTLQCWRRWQSWHHECSTYHTEFSGKTTDKATLTQTIDDMILLQMHGKIWVYEDLGPRANPKEWSAIIILKSMGFYNTMSATTQNEMRTTNLMTERCISSSSSFNRISGKVAYMQPLKLKASLHAHDLVRKHELLDAGHRFGKVSVLATMTG